MRFKRDRTVVEIGVGEVCPRCVQPMKRYGHGLNWKPNPWRGYYRFWDKCAGTRCTDLRSQYPVEAYVPPQGETKEYAPMKPNLSLLKEADALLRKSKFDAVTGEKKDAKYWKKQRIAVARSKRKSNREEKKLGKLGPASEVRKILP